MAGSVDGLISGMDTTSIVSQLMAIEKQGQVRIQNRKTTEQAKITAYQGLNKRLEALRAAADKVAASSAWNRFTVASSSTSVSATASSAALAGSYVFDVTQVAKAQSYVSNATYGSTSEPITTATSITITKDGNTSPAIAVGDGSLASVVSAINNAAAGVKAAAIQVAPGQYRLSLTSTTTGSASTFSIADGGNAQPLGALDSLVAGQDAVLSFGDPATTGYTVTSPTNTISDVLPGVTLTVSKVESGVSLDVSSDVGAAARDVEAMVEALKSVLSEIKTLTAYNPDTKRAATLTGDSTLRSIQQQVLSIVAAPMNGRSMSTVGIQLDRHGQVTFDRSTFESALRSDPTGTAAMFRPGGTTTHHDAAYAGLASTVSLMYADDRTVAGAYDVHVTQAARQASVRLSGTMDPAESLTITVTGKDPVTVTAEPGDDLAALAARVNQQAATDGLGVFAVVDAGALVIRTTAYGSAVAVDATTTGTLVADPAVAGLDVQGTINGVAATGTGRTLQAPTTDTTLRGLAFTITATDADVALAATQTGADQHLFGTFTYTPGLAQRLDSHAGSAVRSDTGQLATVISGKQKLVADLDVQIESWDQRLRLRELALRRQFSNLETTLGSLKNQSSWLSGQLAGIIANTPK